MCHIAGVKANTVEDGGSTEKGDGMVGGTAGEKENARRGPLALKDGRGSEAGVSPVTTSWVTEHDLPHLEPISQFLTTSWNTSTYFLHPSTRTTESPTYLTPFFVSLSVSLTPYWFLTFTSNSLLCLALEKLLQGFLCESSRYRPEKKLIIKGHFCIFFPPYIQSRASSPSLFFFPRSHTGILFHLSRTWNLLMSLGFPAVFRQFWLHFRKNFKKNLQR